jgi:uncharacterized membrane protein
MIQKLYRFHTVSEGQRGMLVAFWILAACDGRLGVSKEAGVAQDAGEDDETLPQIDPDPVSNGEHSDAGPRLQPDAGVVIGAHCQSGTKDGDEGDIDCGGLDCSACVNGASCLRHADCMSGQCLAGVCAGASCTDGVQNGDETGVDCGGATCQHCRSSTCNCASSDAVQPLACDETDGYLSPCGPALATTPDGSVGAFTLCFADPGAISTNHVRAFRWTRARGIEVIADYAAVFGLSSDGANALLHGDTADSLRVVAAGVAAPVPLPGDSVLSADGNSVVGVTRDDAGNYHLARWTRAGGLVTLADLPEGANSWTVQAVTADASTVVGTGDSSAGPLPFRWNAASGLQDLGTLPSNATGARPLQISSDGSVIAGFTTGPTRDLEVFRWTQADALQTIRTTIDFGPGVNPLVLSADGSVVAATGAVGENSYSAFRWDTSDGARLLGFGSGGSLLVDMSSDGSVVLGDGSDGAFLGRAQGTTSMASALAAGGVDLTGWDQLQPQRLSGDGKVVFGSGTCGGVPTYFRWVLPQ